MNHTPRFASFSAVDDSDWSCNAKEAKTEPVKSMSWIEKIQAGYARTVLPTGKLCS